MKEQRFQPLDLLRRLGDQHRHVEQEHHREPQYRGAIRHRLADQMRALETHFERVLVEWTTDETLRATWREFLRGRGPAPDEPRIAQPPLFKGRTDAGAIVEILPVFDGYDVFIDGARSDHTGVPWHLDPDSGGPVLIGEHACDETFDAQPAARARVLVLAVDRSRIGPPTAVLVEVDDLTNPMLRARDVEAVSDSGTGRRGGAKTPLHATPDHRDHRRRDIERHFAARVAEEAAGVRRYPSCELIVVASPVMLGLLQPAIECQIRAKDQVNIHELARDLTKLSGPMLHDLLTESALLPGRGRREPLKPAPGLPG